MIAIRLIIFILFTIISILSLISFYDTKGRWKKKTRKVIDRTPSHRKLEPEEVKAVARLYNIQLKAGSPVYRIEGSYESTELTVKGSVASRISTIGGVLLQWDSNLENTLQDSNTP